MAREGLGLGTLLVPVAVVTAWSVGWWLLVGTAAGVSALGGGLGAVVLLAATPALLGPVVSAAPRSALLSALAFYLLKVTVLSAALVALSAPAARERIDGPALGTAVAVAVLAYTTALVVATFRARRPAYDLSPDLG